MAETLPELPPRHLRTPEAARFLGLSHSTLEKHRVYGTGPKFSKLGGRVVYKLDDLKAWVETGMRSSTHDPLATKTLPARRQAGSQGARGQ